MTCKGRYGASCVDYTVTEDMKYGNRKAIVETHLFDFDKVIERLSPRGSCSGLRGLTMEQGSRLHFKRENGWRMTYCNGNGWRGLLKKVSQGGSLWAIVMRGGGIDISETAVT